MKIIDFFKNKNKEEDIPEKISFKEIKEEVDYKKQKNKENQEAPKKQISSDLCNLLQKIEQGRILLERLNLEEKNAPEKAKLIVKENLIKFCRHLEKLSLKINGLEAESFENFIRLILFFYDFEKESLKSFQKSTFLIGEELERIRKEIIKFYRNFNKIVKENEALIAREKTISLIEGKLMQIEEINKNQLENQREINEIEGLINKLEEQLQNLKKEVEDKKRSEEYLFKMKNAQKIEELKADLSLCLHELKGLIDFKALARVYHATENKMNLIKEYREEFKETFEKYGDEKLVELVNIKEINSEKIKEKIKEIKEKRQEADKIKPEKDITAELLNEIKNTEQKIEALKFEKLIKQKRNEKMEEARQCSKREIIQELIKINLLIED